MKITCWSYLSLFYIHVFQVFLLDINSRYHKLLPFVNIGNIENDFIEKLTHSKVLFNKRLFYNTVYKYDKSINYYFIGADSRTV